MTQILSVSCKLEVTPQLRQEIDKTLERFAQGCNYALEVSRREKVRSANKLQKLTYHDIRANTGLKANHTCQAVRRVCAALKAQKQVHTFRPTSLSLDVRTFSLRQDDWSVGVTLLNGRQWFKLSIGNYQLGLLKGQDPTSAVLVKRKNGDYYIQIQVEIPTQPPGKVPKVIGVDLGRVDVAYTSDGESWDGGVVKATRAKYFQVRRSIQRRRTRSSRKLLRRLSGKEQRFQKNINHTISYQLVKKAKASNRGISLEDLTGITKRTRVRKAQRREHKGWAFYQLRQFIEYKCKIAGVPLFLVNPAYTSKTCSRCHHIGDRKGKVFKCGYCGLHVDADWNGATNISSLGVALARPEIPGMSCLLQGQLPLVCAA